MSDSVNLTNHFLIAMPALADPNFFHTVTYICEHNEEGAMGLVINRPMDLSASELFEQLDLTPVRDELNRRTIFQGGPVHTERGFVLHRPATEWEATIMVSDQIAVTMSHDILEAIANDAGPAQFLIMLGYAGWGAGQLEEELAANAWLTGSADPDIIFNLPAEQCWAASAAHIGIQLDRLSNDIGHA